MPLVKCDKCNGTGSVEAEDAGHSLMSMLEIVLTKDRVVVRTKPSADASAEIPKLPSLEEQQLGHGEQFGNVVEKIHGPQ